MKRVSFALLSLAALSACEPQPAGEPVVTVDLGDEDGIQPVGAPVVAPTPETVPLGLASACRAVRVEEIDLTH